jgi:hypothetical protein
MPRPHQVSSIQAFRKTDVSGLQQLTPFLRLRESRTDTLVWSRRALPFPRDLIERSTRGMRAIKNFGINPMRRPETCPSGRRQVRAAVLALNGVYLEPPPAQPSFGF